MTSSTSDSNVALARHFLSVRSDSEPLLAALARRAIDSIPFDMDGRLLDLGCGTGHLSNALAQANRNIVSTDLNLDDLASGSAPVAFQSDGTCLAVATESIDGVICSNVLEHTPNPERVLEEIARILVPGGWAWISWTPWYAPFGGHAIAPLHYFGPERGLRYYRRLIGEPSGKNLPFDGVWPNTITGVVESLEALPQLETLDIVPRYYPRQRWIMRLKRGREVLAWNCVITVRKDPVVSPIRTP